MTDIIKEEINDFIDRRFPIDCHWLDGNCYWFALILSKRFNYLNIYYEPIDGHFLAGNGETFFDWLGEAQPISQPQLLDDIMHED